MATPLVTVVTPVYNDGRYLRECIESVRAQQHARWEYVIVDNRSTDDSAAIAREYAARDPRIRVVVNQDHVGVIRNHNIAFRCLSPESAYCKVVQADDWLFPDCLTAMVALAERHPSVAIVSSYRLNGAWVDLDGLVNARELRGPSLALDGLPWLTSVVPGRDVCRASLLGAPYVFGTPTSLLFRADAVRRHETFYDEASLHADKGACFEILRGADFGFVHQVLTYSRAHDEDGTVTAVSQRFNTFLAGNLALLAKYGPGCLEPEEYDRCLREHLDRYYAFLARSLVTRPGRDFWEFHAAAMSAVGFPLSRGRVLRALASEIAHVPLRLERGLSTLARLRRRRGRSAGREDEIHRVVRRMRAHRAAKDAEAREAAVRAGAAAGPPTLTSRAGGS
jgi:glycosyltransferase involved in cell wall biosynthesis